MLGDPSKQVAWSGHGRQEAGRKSQAFFSFGGFWLTGQSFKKRWFRAEKYKS